MAGCVDRQVHGCEIKQVQPPANGGISGRYLGIHHPIVAPFLFGNFPSKMCVEANEHSREWEKR